jgi:hypothetical protein
MIANIGKVHHGHAGRKQDTHVADGGTIDNQEVLGEGLKVGHGCFSPGASSL